MRYYGKGHIGKGTPEDTTRCAASVYRPEAHVYPQQCSKKRIHGELCSIHERMRIQGKALYIPKDEA